MSMQPTAERQIFEAPFIEVPPVKPVPKGKWFFVASLAAHCVVLGMLWFLGSLLPSSGNGDFDGVVITLTYGKPGCGSAGEIGGGGDGSPPAQDVTPQSAAEASPLTTEPVAQQAEPAVQEHKKTAEPAKSAVAKSAVDDSQSSVSVPRLAAHAPVQKKPESAPQEKPKIPNAAKPEKSSAQKEKAALSSEAKRSTVVAKAELDRPVEEGFGEGRGAGLGQMDGKGQAQTAGAGQGRGSGSGGVGNGAANEGQGDAGGYLKGNYEYIKKRIRKYLVYSPQAKRMGIQGLVYVAFTIARDGSAQNVELRTSSGFASLDESALEAVHSASPFAPPPHAARVVVPIQFSLK